MGDQNTKTEDKNSSNSQPAADESRSGAGAIRKLGKAVSTLSGYKSVTSNLKIIKHRASLPLLQRILKNELKTNKGKSEAVQGSDISQSDIDRSYFWHTFIVAITLPATIWLLITLTNSIAIGVRFGIWGITLNPALYTSAPMLVFVITKLYVSWHSRKAFKLIAIEKEGSLK